MDPQGGDIDVQRKDGIDQEVPVLEESQDPEVGDDAAREQPLPSPGIVGARDANGESVVDDLRDPKQPQEPPVPPAVEDVRENEEHVDASSPRRRRVIDRSEGKEEDQERRCVEEQGLPG